LKSGKQNKVKQELIEQRQSREEGSFLEGEGEIQTVASEQKEELSSSSARLLFAAVVSFI